MKYLNHLLLLVLLLVGFLLKEHIHISTNLLSLFASKESVEKLSIANHLGYSKEMLIAVKGFSKESKQNVREITKKLQSLQDIEFVQFTLTPSQDIAEYYKKYYPLLASFQAKKLTKKEVQKQLQTLYDKQLHSVFYTSIDKNDPLKLFHLELTKSATLKHKGNMIVLGEYGYLIRVQTNIPPSEMGRAKRLYDEVQSIIKVFPDTVAFAPFFYTVENSAAFKSDVQWIAILSSIVLILIYFLLLRNIKLLVETLVTLFSSMVFAALFATTFFDNFNVLSLAFGMSLTAVSIDYLLHYYFHNFYESKKRVDKNVLYGFLTTLSAFGVFSFIPIPIISQISFFALFSLSYAYVVFSFVFPYLGIKSYTRTTEVQSASSGKKISALSLFFISLILFSYSAFHFKLDANIRNLDYQNLSLKSAEKLFKDNSKSSLSPVIVEAPSKELLIENLHILKHSVSKSFSLASFVLDKKTCEQKRDALKQYNFTQLRAYIEDASLKVGFRDAYFKDAYKFAEKKQEYKLPNLNIFQSFSLSAYNDGKRWYSIALVDDAQKAQTLPFVTDINVKAMFDKSTQQMYKKLVLFGSFVLVIIFVLLLVSVRKKILYALNYILFPVALSLAVLTTLGSINIMHLFSLIILVAIGIDYGIYMSNSKKPTHTMLAIKYSLLSTFAAFGVLIFSSIVALNSIGMVITIGCVAIYILIKVMR